MKEYKIKMLVYPCPSCAHGKLGINYRVLITDKTAKCLSCGYGRPKEKIMTR